MRQYLNVEVGKEAEGEHASFFVLAEVKGVTPFPDGHALREEAAHERSLHDGAFVEMNPDVAAGLHEKFHRGDTTRSRDDRMRLRIKKTETCRILKGNGNQLDRSSRRLVNRVVKKRK